MQSTEIRSVAIVGDGKMGRSIFNHLFRYPFNITWINITTPEADRNKLMKRLKRQLDNGILNEEEFREKANAVQITSDLQAIRGCDLLIEALPEDPHLKSTLFKEASRFIDDSAILTSNSSSILPERFHISQSLQERFAGMHFFYPVEKNALVEIIPHPQCHALLKVELIQFAKTIEKYYLVQDAQTAFACNRFFLEIQASLFCFCLDHGIDFSIADEEIQKVLFPTGIFAMMEHIGFAILETSLSNYLSSAISVNEVSRFLDALKSLNAKGMSSFLPGSVLKNSEPDSRIIDVVNSLFFNFATKYIRREMFTAEQLRTVICEYTGSDYAPF